MKVLGIDPGSHRTGWAVLEEVAAGRPPVVLAHGTLVPKASLPLHERLVLLGHGIGEIACTHAPAVVAMEESFFAKNARTALVLGHARGALIAAACARGAAFFEYSPSSVKKMVGGSGRSSKEGMAKLMALQLRLTELPESLDASDAIAVAWTHIQQMRSPLATATKGRKGKQSFDVDAYLRKLREQKTGPVIP